MGVSGEKKVMLRCGSMDEALQAVFKTGSGKKLLYEYDKRHVIMQMGDSSVVDMEATMGDKDICQVSMTR